MCPSVPQRLALAAIAFAVLAGQAVAQSAQPAEPPAITSRPVQIPEVARNLLDSVGISAGYGAQGNGARLAAKR